MARHRWLISGAFSVACLAVAVTAWAQVQRYSGAPVRIRIDATPIESFDIREPTQTRFGALTFRGGLSLTANSPVFGGLSGLHMEADGEHFLAVSDRGSWFRGRIVYRDEKPVGIADAEMAPILGGDGTPLAAYKWFDTESLTESEGLFYVGIERVEQIVRFNLRAHGLAAQGEAIKVPPDFKSFVFNKSLECLAAAPKGSSRAGALIAITEQSLDAAGNHRAFVINGGDTVRFSVKRSDDFSISDCAMLPSGDLLLLERHFSVPRGVAMRIRSVPLASIEDGAVVDGPKLIDADLGYQIDNMEGMSIHRTPSGETVLTLVSDDNFSPIQRNLLLQFTLD